MKLGTDIILNEKQKSAYEAMAKGENVFITGAGGTGKSMLISKFVKEYRKFRQIAITSTTGTSAVLINGVTIHSFLGIGLGKGPTEFLYNKIKRNKMYLRRWTNTECLIIDEVSMLTPDLFDKIEHLGRLLRYSSEPFGGMQIVLTGDFLQLPCIGTSLLCFDAESWDRVVPKTVYLTEIMRQSDSVFQRCLSKVRVGDMDDETYNILESRVGAELDNEDGVIPTRLMSLRDEVNFINDGELEKLAEDELEFRRYDMEIEFMTTLKNAREKRTRIDKIKKGVNVGEVLELCVGAQVMLCRNLDFDGGLINGSRGVVVEFKEDMPCVKFVNGVTRVIDFEEWEIEEDGKTVAVVTQVPLKVAYALSIHSCQGATLDYVILDTTNIFEDGQGYVALSRVKRLEGLSITNLNIHTFTANKRALSFYEKV